MLEDLRANGWSLRPCCMVAAYRIAHFCSVWRKKNIINNLWAAPVLVMYRLITECLFGYEIQAAASIGRRFTIHHGYGVVINKNVVAGDDFTLRHGVTIGNLGANIALSPNACLAMKFRLLHQSVVVSPSIMVMGWLSIKTWWRGMILPYATA